MERKYELVKEDTIKVYGKVLYRIRALKDFGDIKVGQLGGYIEIERNLSHEGKCWVSDNARVFGCARVSGYARVSDNARVFSCARVSGNAQISGNACVSGNAWISSNDWVSGNVLVSGNAHVAGNAQVCGNARILKDANVRESSDCIVVGPIGSRNDYTTFYKTKTGDIMVSCGCFNDTIDEFIKAVNTTHEDNEKYRKQYLDTVEYIKNILI